MSDTFDYEEEHAHELDAYKRHLASYGIFTGILVVMFGLLVLFALISRSTYTNGLLRTVQNTLDTSGSYKVLENMSVDSAITNSCMVYRVLNLTEKNQELFAVIVRITTLYGPQGAVFLYDLNTKDIQFVDYVNISGRAKQSIIDASKLSQIQYWEEKIPLIMEKVNGKK